MTDIVELKITLRDVEPQVTRLVQIPGGYSLRRVHDVIQAVMGWYDMHLHDFKVGDKTYGVPDLDGPISFGIRTYDDRNIKLEKLIERGVTAFTYIYDFGDDWTHDVQVMRTLAPEEGVDYPVLLEWSGACPPEDVGGPPGYADFLEAINDPEHEAHEDVVAWNGEVSFDTQFLDMDAVNAMLSRIRASRRKGPRGGK
ncbi:MAG: hypothetical protein VR70_05250 [Rhodospirillaceae bacterium BRH_c57]|nr:MAG: hypothetical protein VR70_05250 [Rhodospirillaceae bacterium BRH_c57]